MRRFFAKLVVVVSLAVLSPTLALAGEVASPEEQVNNFARALLAGDMKAVESLLSQELLERIIKRGTGSTYAERLQSFIERERNKLLQSTEDNHSALAEGFTVTSMKAHAEGTVLALHLGLAGQSLPKPFYVVLEGGEYKVNMIQPASGDLSTMGSSTYVVKNEDLELRGFSCGSNSTLYVSPFQTVSESCPDTCGFWDGTRFYAGGGYADCDWNQWGVDMYIRSSYPVCADRC